MTTQLSLLQQMSLVLDRLLEVAKVLKEKANEYANEEELECLQERQSEIIAELGALDQLLRKSPAGATEQELDLARMKVRERLAHFQVINQEFFQRLNSAARVIEKEE